VNGERQRNKPLGHPLWEGVLKLRPVSRKTCRRRRPFVGPV